MKLQSITEKQIQKFRKYLVNEENRTLPSRNVFVTLRRLSNGSAEKFHARKESFNILACSYFLALPLTITINAAGNSFLKLLTIPIAGYFAVSWFFYHEKLELNIVHLLSFAYLITVVMTLFADRSPVALQYVRGYFETVGLMFLITMRKYAENEIKAFEITQLTLLGVLITLGFIGADWYGDRNTMIIFGTTSDPNYFFGFFLLPMAVALKKLRDNKIYTIICAALLALGAYMVFTSDSRGVLLGLAVMIMSYVFINAKGTKQRIIGICTAIGMAIILWMVVIPILPEDVSSRFSIQKIIKSHGTGRGDIWLSMLNTIKHSSWELMYGRGIFAYHEMMIDGKLMHVVAHNQFIQSLYNQGIPGIYQYDWSVPFGFNSNGKLVFWLGDLNYMDAQSQAILKGFNVDSDHLIIDSEFFQDQMNCMFSRPIKEKQILMNKDNFILNVKKKYNIDLTHLEKECSSQTENIGRPLVFTEQSISGVINAFDKVLVEGFDVGQLRELYKTLYTESERDAQYERWQSIRLIKEILLKWCEKLEDTIDVETLVSPLYILHDYRIYLDHLLSEEKQENTKMHIVETLGVQNFEEQEAIYFEEIERLDKLFQYLVLLSK